MLAYKNYLETGHGVLYPYLVNLFYGADIHDVEKGNQEQGSALFLMVSVTFAHILRQANAEIIGILRIRSWSRPETF